MSGVDTTLGDHAAACWRVQAGESHEHIAQWMRDGVVTISWGSIPGLEDPRDYPEDELRRLLLAAGRGDPTSDIKELFGFRDDMAIGDFVISPSQPKARAFVVGKVIGEYEYRSETDIGDHHHFRRAKWFGEWPGDAVSAEMAKSLVYRRTVRFLPSQEEWLAFAHEVSGGSGEPPQARLQRHRPARSTSTKTPRTVTPDRRCPSCGLTKSPAMFDGSELCRDCA